MAVTPEEASKFREFLSGMSAADRATLLAAPPTGPKSPKMTPALDALSDTDRVAVVHACRRGLKGKGEGATDDTAYDEVAKVAPAAAAAMRASASVRPGKGAEWALSSAASYLQSPEWRAKREANRDVVPPEPERKPAAK